MSTRLRLSVVLRLLALGGAVACVASCGSSALATEAAVGAGGGSGSIVVYGLTTSSSAGAVAAGLTVTAEDSACSGISYGSATGTSSSSGLYRIAVTSSSVHAGCVVVTGAVPGSGNVVSVQTPDLSFAGGDSVQVNLTLP